MSRSMANMRKGELGKVLELKNSGDIRRRLMDIGFTSGTVVECIGKSPLGDPTAYLVKGSVIALRSEDSAKIMLESNLERNMGIE